MRRLTTAQFKRWTKADDAMVRAAMPKTSAADPPVEFAWHRPSDRVPVAKPLTFKLGEVLHS